MQLIQNHVQQLKNAICDLLGLPALAALHDLTGGFHEFEVEFTDKLGKASL